CEGCSPGAILLGGTCLWGRAAGASPRPAVGSPGQQCTRPAHGGNRRGCEGWRPPMGGLCGRAVGAWPGPAGSSSARRHTAPGGGKGGRVVSDGQPSKDAPAGTSPWDRAAQIVPELASPLSWLQRVSPARTVSALVASTSPRDF